MRQNHKLAPTQATRCRSTKINGNKSTLDAHHYPDGVLGERRRPPNREQTEIKRRRPPRWFSDSHCLVLLQWQSWERTAATEPSVGFKLGTRDSEGAPNQMPMLGRWPPLKKKKRMPSQPAVINKQIQTLWNRGYARKNTHHAIPCRNRAAQRKKICNCFFTWCYCEFVVFLKKAAGLWAGKIKKIR